MQEQTTEKLQNFSLRLRGLAEARNLSQADIGRALGIKWPAVGNWFQGRNLPKRQHRARLAELLGVSVDWLICGEEKATEVNEEGSVDYGLSKKVLEAALARTLVVTQGHIPNIASLEKSIRDAVEHAIAAAAGDPRRLGWISEQLAQHLSVPAHWKRIDAINREAIERAQEIRREMDHLRPPENQSSDRAAK